VVVQLERLAERCVLQRPFQRTLGGGRERHVTHRTARRADGVVVMVIGDLLTQFVVGVFVTHGDLAHQPCVLEHGEVPVHGTLCQRRLTLQDHGNGHGSAGLFEGAENELTPGRQPLAVLAETVESDVIDVGHCREL
jgi:hypothetical protein